MKRLVWRVRCVMFQKIRILVWLGLMRNYIEINMSEKFGGMPSMEVPKAPDFQQRLRELSQKLEDAEHNKEEMERARDSYSLVIETVRGWFPQLVENDYLVNPKEEIVREFLNDLAFRADFMEELRRDIEEEQLTLLQAKNRLGQN